MEINRKIGASGKLSMRFIPKYMKPGLSWRVRHWLSLQLWWGIATVWLAKQFSRITGIMVATGELRAKYYNAEQDQWYDLGLLGRRVITTVFVNDIVDNLIAEGATFGDYKWHDSGTGTNAPAVGDTALQTPTGVARVSGTQVENAANIYETVATITYDGTYSVTEFGLFNASTSGILCDRDTFTAQPVNNGDKIEFTYRLTFTAGS